MKGTKEEDLFLMVEIGDQNEWNDANNKYRTHPLYQVKQLPTLLSLSFLQGQTQVASRLEGEPCLNLENVQKLFKGN
ncbi:unnamed protein product [Trichobilharzia regenti]|nr:unnamed protein product [Trichobilharzia regenti]